MYMHVYTYTYNLHTTACTYITKYLYIYMYCIHVYTHDIVHMAPTGRSTMKQYMPMKPVKRGFKVWVRADAVNGYFCTFDVYVGRPSDGATTEVGLGERIVLQLSESLRGGNYQLYSDNYFTTCHLLDTLHTHQLYGCGTTRTNRREFPETLKTVSLERGEHAFCQRGDLVASVWQDKKPVHLLSTLAQADVHTLHRENRRMVADSLCSVLMR